MNESLVLSYAHLLRGTCLGLNETGTRYAAMLDDVIQDIQCNGVSRFTTGRLYQIGAVLGGGSDFSEEWFKGISERIAAVADSFECIYKASREGVSNA